MGGFQASKTCLRSCPSWCMVTSLMYKERQVNVVLPSSLGNQDGIVSEQKPSKTSLPRPVVVWSRTNTHDRLWKSAQFLTNAVVVRAQFLEGASRAHRSAGPTWQCRCMFHHLFDKNVSPSSAAACIVLRPIDHAAGSASLPLCQCERGNEAKHTMP